MKNVLLAISFLLLMTPVLAIYGNGLNESMLGASIDSIRTQVMNQSQLRNSIMNAIQSRERVELSVNGTNITAGPLGLTVSAERAMQGLSISEGAMSLGGMQVMDKGMDIRTQVMARVQTMLGEKGINITVGDDEIVLNDEEIDINVTIPLNHQIRIQNGQVILNKSGVEQVLTVLPAQAIQGISAAQARIKSMKLEMEGETPVYNIIEEKQAKLFAFIPIGMEVVSKVSAENSTLMSQSRPWWSFLATETE